MTLAATDVRWQRGAALVVDGVSLTPEPGDTVGLLGPNGSGKSSLLQLMNGAVKPTSGVVTLDGADMNAVRRRDIAKVVAVVSQHADTDFDLTVADVVRLGRIPHRGAFGGNATADQRAVDAALAHTGLTDKAHRLWHQLSGGERQRAQIARALAQEPRELLLDEPTNHLDIQHQLELLSLVSRLPITSVVALHDLNLAAMFCTKVIVLSQGRVVATGIPSEVLTEELIEEVYNVRARVQVDDDRRVFIRFGI
ncbi:ABC transporter ATP-binding protein [Rhodococcus sp. BP-252]|uniref:ABC transporter ATP-binding protein n=1 Tax=unclassified Rhodococcus (in: high G+C Gram-positive bacteria) TaxID=192944 RepID=UPI001C9BA0E9|nr:MULTISPECIES: ABC transporter ATP-binding protein [unclassified Rhodococcus (in: high G+C Gram-positive bacteria)]MBY6410249.1 ABC transporter ATP-binding protein [Rhodococcus sp. BP-320]MBY6415218.1 ABC transporter ATP-binding protein [Rhodococcus sp. BP-321]MBY6424226.1 ABC transporter ATP-binding protein [Rhodococcus sp. BP-324]MBY6429366.1 ABC transporter ATP-binding protein [Rhodococcus sp. BP-323]MBY6430114.1 ABC transporter ATP-binding protein [Rhodococcus sp. BP-322]